MLFAWTLVACTVRLPEPTLTAVRPDQGWNGEDTVVAIAGSGFVPQVEINVNRGGQADLDRGYVARLDGAAGQFVLSGVSAVDYDNLRAVVDPGLPPGRYALVVEGPTGRIARLDDAFTVAATRADRLSLTSEVVGTVNSPVPITLTVLDPDGEPVPEDLQVRLSFRDTHDGPFAGTIGLGLDDQATGSDGVITGFLGPDGTASLPLTVHRPGTVTIVAEALTDDAVRSDELAQAWLPGTDLVVAITRREPDRDVRVGEPIALDVRLEDQFGNLVTNANTNVTLQMACGSDLTSFVLNGEQQVSITPSEATNFNNDCLEQFVRSVSGPAGRSASFEVLAGEAARMFVQNLLPEYRAGQPYTALVGTRDAFGNRTLTPGPVVLQDSVGGLGPTTCAFLPSGDQNCSAIGVVAGEGVVATATSAAASTDAVSGSGLPYDVLPGREVGRIEAVFEERFVAGAPSDLRITVEDLYGNRIPLDALNAFELQTPEPDACSPGTVQPDDSVVFSCTFEQARDGAAVEVVANSSSASLPITVVNADPGDAVLSAPAAVVAGELFPIDAVVVDAFGNPVLETDVDLEIRDEQGTTTVPLVLDAGTGIVEIGLTRAGARRLQVFADGQPVGQPVAVQVAAAAAEGLLVTLDQPWVFIGTEVELRIESVDSFGNRALSSDLLTVETGLGPTASVQLVGGAAQLPYTWTQTGLDSVVTASSPTLSGELSNLDVVASCGDGPTAAASFAGAPVGRACAAAGVAVDALLSMAGTTPGANPLVAYRAATDVQLVESDLSGFAVPVVGPGRTPVRALAVDASLCADEVETAVWVGPDDGTPVGPLGLTVPAAASLGGAVSVGLTGAVDCTGAPAVGADVRVRTDRGELVGPTPTGSGLAVTLDPFGGAIWTLDLTATQTGGLTTLVAEVPSGAARGEATLPVDGDLRGPAVWQLEAIGDPATAVEIQFSEPLDPTSVAASSFVLTASEPVSTTVAVLAPDRVRIDLSPPLDLSGGALTVRALTTLTDVAGNPLEGTQSGVAADWTGAVGGTVVDPAPVVCSVTPVVFRPDGDPGTGIDADRVDVDATSASTPAFWQAIVRDDAGTTLVRERIVPTGPAALWSWDGRDVDGRVQPDGLYTIDFRSDNGAGRTTGGCVQSITLANGTADAGP
jgi:hypothetical protein